MKKALFLAWIFFPTYCQASTSCLVGKKWRRVPKSSSAKTWEVMHFRFVIQLFLLFALCYSTVLQAVKPEWCAKYLGSAAAGNKKEEVKPELELVDDMLWAFSNGLIPDPKNLSQLRAFEVYLKMRFGEPQNVGNVSETVEKVAKELRWHPNLEKVPFRNQVIAQAELSYPVTPELKDLMKGPIEAGGQAKGSLFQIEANLGYWKKILHFEEAKAPPDLSKEGKKEWAAKEKTRFMEYLNGVVPAELRAELINSKYELSVEEKATRLFSSLNQAREKLLKENKDVTGISRAMVDLVHTIGFHNKEIQSDLKGEDGLKRIKALKRVLDERDRFAMALEFPGHFEEVLTKLKISAPSGIDSNRSFRERMSKIEEGVTSQAVVQTSKGSVKEVRQLSLMEAPFRSCLGGSDCSSRTYLTKALDPNYQYFTITDSEGFSSGHITIVLGGVTEKSGGVIPFLGSSKEKKVAFIDKVQNVSNEDLPFMVEAVRRSLLEKGYTLVLPEDVGDHNGISNVDSTRDFIKRKIATTGNTLKGFKPHSHEYNFENKYSRAELGLPVREVAELTLPEHIRFTPTEEAHSWRTKELDLNKLVEGARKLKDGTVDDRIRYIEAQKTIKAAGLEKDPLFEKTIEKWLADSTLPFPLRKRVLLLRWLEEGASLPELLKDLKPLERVDLLQNCLDTPRLRENILKKKNQIPGLLVQVRSNKKLIQELSKAYSSKNGVAIAHILEAKDISDDLALSAISQIQKCFSTQNMEEATEILRLVGGTSSEGEIREALMAAYAANVSNRARLAREVVKHLGHEDKLTSDFARKFLKGSEETEASKPNLMLQAVNEIEEVAKAKQITHKNAAEEWLSDSTRNTELKAEYLRAHLAARDFEKLEEKIPQSQRERVLEHLDKKANGRLFRRIAKEKNLPVEVISRLTAESLEYEGFHFPNGGEKVTLGSPANELGRSSVENQREVVFTKPFEMQATLVTQAQWALIMGNNPSNFKGDNPIEINGVKVDPNRPVERVSWNDVQEFIKKLNSLDPKFNYRLPTAAEWEYSARAKTTTRFSFGENEAELGEHGWFSGNSGKATHPVAELKPNAFGLYDMHGNTWEWVHDWYASTPSGGTDPQGPASGSFRFVRGGSWYSPARHLRSAFRPYSSSSVGDSGVGFRLVRTPK